MKIYIPTNFKYYDNIFEFHKIVSLYQECCVSVFPFLSYMSMLVPIVLVVGTKDFYKQTMAMLFIAVYTKFHGFTNKLWTCCKVHCYSKFHVCPFFVSTWIYSILALNMHLPFLFDVVALKCIVYQ